MFMVVTAINRSDGNLTYRLICAVYGGGHIKSRSGVEMIPGIYSACLEYVMYLNIYVYQASEVPITTSSPNNIPLTLPTSNHPSTGASLLSIDCRDERHSIAHTVDRLTRDKDIPKMQFCS
jgi:hypothetical protein